MRPEIVMFLKLSDVDHVEHEPESREVTHVPLAGEVIVVSRRGRYRVIGREWQWDSSGRLRVVVFAGPIPVPPPVEIAAEGYARSGDAEWGETTLIGQAP